MTDPAPAKPYVYHVLMVSLLLLFPIHALGDAFGGLGNAVLDLGTAFVIFACMVAVGRTRRQRLVGRLLGVPAIALSFLRLAMPDALWGFSEAVSLGIFVFLIVVLMGTFVRERRFTMATVSASLSVYLLIGLTWATLYGVVYVHDHDAFRVPTDIDPVVVAGAGALQGEPADAGDAAGRSTRRGDGDTRSGLFYFSFVTLTTLGYGDITPVTPVAMALASLEAIVGQLFLVVVVAAAVARAVAQERLEG